MNERERDDFLAGRRVGIIGIPRREAGPLLAPIWYRFDDDAQRFSFCMGGSSAKALLLRAAGRASLCVQAEDYPYRYVSVEGPVTIEALGAQTYSAIRAMASRYLGPEAGRRYAEQFNTPDEVQVTLTPLRWRAEVPGRTEDRSGSTTSSSNPGKGADGPL